MSALRLRRMMNGFTGGCRVSNYLKDSGRLRERRRCDCRESKALALASLDGMASVLLGTPGRFQALAIGLVFPDIERLTSWLYF